MILNAGWYYLARLSPLTFPAARHLRREWLQRRERQQEAASSHASVRRSRPVTARQPTECRRRLPPVYPSQLRAESGAVDECSLAHLHAKTEPGVSGPCSAASPGAGAKAALRAISRKEDRNTALPTFRDLLYCLQSQLRTAGETLGPATAEGDLGSPEEGCRQAMSVQSQNVRQDAIRMSTSPSLARGFMASAPSWPGV